MANGSWNGQGISITEVPEALEKACSPPAGDSTEAVMITDVDISGQVESIRQRLVERTDGYGVPQLERLYSRVIRGVITATAKHNGDDKVSILRHLSKIVEDGNFEL